MNDTLLATLRTMQPELAAIRQDIHTHPEIGMEEERTAALVAAKLREYGLEVVEGIGKHGVVATLKGRLPGQRAIGLRADMDALMIHETTGLPYASQNAGKMHACGHDGHTTMLLGAAQYLAKNPDFGGTVHFIFQPAEEGRGGAVAMLKDGLFDRFPVDAVYGLHNQPGLPLGQFATRTGPALAAADSWEVTFSGTGGHGGAGAHLATDVTIAVAQFVTALQTVVSRNVPARESAVISVGAIAGGSFDSPNVMPSVMRLCGTARSYLPEVRDLLEQRIGELAQSVAASFGCTAAPVYRRGTTALINHADQTRVTVAAAAALVGDAKVDDQAPAEMGAEDFAFMLEARPGSYIFMGQAAGGATSEKLHTPTYDFNDDAIPYGVGYWVSLVQQEMGEAR